MPARRCSPLPANLLAPQVLDADCGALGCHRNPAAPVIPEGLRNNGASVTGRLRSTPGCDPPRVVVGTSPYVVSHAPALVTAQSQGAGVSAAGLDSMRAEVRRGAAVTGDELVSCVPLRRSPMDKGDWRSASSARRGAAHTAALLTLLCIATSHAHAEDRNPLRTSDRIGGIVHLPVVDGRDIRFLRFSVEEAPRSRIRGITQDDYGFLWLATNVRPVPVRWVPPQTLPARAGDPASLSADRVFTVYKARDGALWIGTASGLTAGPHSGWLHPLRARSRRRTESERSGQCGPPGP